MAIEKIENFNIDIDEKRIYRLIGYKKRDQELREPVKRAVAEEKERLASLIKPVSIYKIISHRETNSHPVFQNAEKIALCLCTIGPKLEEEISRLMKKNEVLRALILDSFGSEAAEAVAEQSDRIIAEKARQMNLWPSKRFSPGYGNWDIKEQRFIFKMLPGDLIGVCLTESFMMIPRKSVSFRINFYRNRDLSTRRVIKDLGKPHEKKTKDEK